MAPTTDKSATDPFASARRRMVDEQIRQRENYSDGVLTAMRTVPRHRFVPEAVRSQAYDDCALPLGPDQSISQPFIVATMTHHAAPSPGKRVLEIGTGSGYQAAVLAELTDAVFTIERNPVLARQAAAHLSAMRYSAVRTLCADGRLGWEDAAPFHAILITACTSEIPPALIRQLAIGGRLIAPMGHPNRTQTLAVFTKQPDETLQRENVLRVRFVPLD